MTSEITNVYNQNAQYRSFRDEIHIAHFPGKSKNKRSYVSSFRAGLLTPGIIEPDNIEAPVYEEDEDDDGGDRAIEI